MSDSVRTVVKCQDPGDGSGDVMIELPSEILTGMNLGLGDSLSIELINGVLSPIRDADARS
ncbi:AbrB/MazE/SpoVT family DNA-binding domain-containing protein [Pseudomonas syringae]|uniref:AbrB/MazE/SpoVT family DNA-binding domain-containing protein n=1 Tax=Pseudomonas syringae TaxID=317 RepID=UPI00177CCCF6|nr:AbrB/MazE/SpoVT family DNA-binding domain-containing protein [Pseudomonas syringae]